jgi:HAD superfamily hydrolase (TIGR01509 family)
MIPTLFDVCALSYEVHAVKPERAIYEAAARLAGYEPNEIFFVDDRPENVAGAREAGFESVLYTDVPQFVTDLRKHGFRFNY